MSMVFACREYDVGLLPGSPNRIAMHTPTLPFKADAAASIEKRGKIGVAHLPLADAQGKDIGNGSWQLILCPNRHRDEQ
jgi:hypothetical protein